MADTIVHHTFSLFVVDCSCVYVICNFSPLVINTHYFLSEVIKLELSYLIW